MDCAGGSDGGLSPDFPEEAAAHGADPMLCGAGHGGFQPVRAVSCHQM